MQVPLEWFALSAGARISMDSGTENMDWVAAALKRIVEFTQAGGEINVVVAGINVGAQPYWNAEATMLMHTKGILVMTPDSAMVLTGKQSLDFSGGVSAEDNFGIGGYDRVMGPNGQAQYWAPNLPAALDVLMEHYAHTYVVPGEDGPRRAATTDPSDRDITPYPHSAPDSDFQTVGEIFSAASNPERKKAFDIRTVMRAVADQDHATLERWAGMADADTAVVMDAHVGGWPVCLLGIESRPVPRRGFPPTDGPDVYTAGTLFPKSSKKAARAINAASGNRPLVVLANLSGFDGSPDSMRNLQLEYGAEIGRAIVNFQGPIVFVVISRYHGGAFVVFSKALNPQMTVLAVEGSYASVIGGAPAAAVVFAGEVEKRAGADPRRQALEAQLAEARVRTGSAAHRAGRPQVDAAGGEDQRGRRGVRRRPQHPPGGRGRLRGRGDRGAGHPAADHLRDREGLQSPAEWLRSGLQLVGRPSRVVGGRACRDTPFGGRACRDHAAPSVVEPVETTRPSVVEPVETTGARRWSSPSRPHRPSVVEPVETTPLRVRAGQNRAVDGPRRVGGGSKKFSKIVSRTPVENPVFGA